MHAEIQTDPLRRRLADGALGGVAAGATVAAFYLVTDLIRLAPLATPGALSGAVVGPLLAVDWDFPVVDQVVRFALFGLRLLLFTALHFLAFAALGAAAVLLADAYDRRLHIGTGALYGVTVFTIAFYAVLLLGRETPGLPSLPGVIVANLMAGTILGGWVQLAARQRRLAAKQERPAISATA